MAVLAVTAIGPDRRGIAARVTRALWEEGGVLRDASMTLLGGCATVAALVEAELDPSELEARLADALADLRLAIMVRALGESWPSAPPTHVLSVHGPDRSDLVHDVTSVLAEQQVNITELLSRPLEGEQPVCALQLEVNAGTQEDADQLVALLREEVPDARVHAEPLEVTTL